MKILFFALAVSVFFWEKLPACVELQVTNGLVAAANLAMIVCEKRVHLSIRIVWGIANILFAALQYDGLKQKNPVSMLAVLLAFRLCVLGLKWKRK